MKILVTGGSGFLGKRLVQKLSAKHKVTIFSRNKHEDMPENVGFAQGDVLDLADVERAVKGMDAVYHLAISLNEHDPKMYEINTKGTKNVAEACKKHKVGQLVYMSSSGVLGETRIPAKEKFDYNPKTLYEKSKMEGEQIVIRSGVPYTIVRTTIIIGPNMIWAQIFEAAKRGFPIIGSGKNYFHLVYVDDVARMLFTVLDNKKAVNQIFHVASKDTPTYEEVYKMICDELNVKMTDKHIPLTVAYAGSFVHTAKRKLAGKQPSLTKSRSSIDRLIRNRIMSTEKARNVLGFEPKYDTRSALHETIKYLRIARLGYSDYDLTQVHKVKGGKKDGK